MNRFSPRQIEALKGYMLAAAVSLGFVWLLVDTLTK